MSRRLRLIAAVAVVLVALSGFSPGRKGGGHHRSGGKSGGCSSSSSSSHNSGRSSYDSVSKGGDDSDGGSYSRSRRYDHTTGTTGTTGSRNGSAGAGSPSGTVTRCAARSGSEAEAVVEVRNPKSRTRTLRVKVEFVDSSGLEVDSGEARVVVGGRNTESVDVRMDHPKRIGDVSECLVESVR